VTCNHHGPGSEKRKEDREEDGGEESVAIDCFSKRTGGSFSYGQPGKLGFDEGRQGVGAIKPKRTLESHWTSPRIPGEESDTQKKKARAL